MIPLLVAPRLQCMNFRTGWRRAGMLLSLMVVTASQYGAEAAEKNVRPPNIVFLLADDLGYGDVKCFGGDRCQIETPGFDRLAREGMKFTDAYANASVCVPTRMALMTGRYAWRFGRGEAGGPWGFLGPRLPLGTATVGSLLQGAGYRTGYVGKWHLGTRMETSDGRVQGPLNVDFSRPLRTGPRDYGFDESFILPGSLDMYPYAFVRNHHWVGDVSAHKGWSAFHRVGPAATDFQDTQVLKTFCDEADKFIAESTAGEASARPFFLYVALTAPHTPISPSEAFRGKSKLGLYGDFVMEADHCVTRLLESLARHGVDQETLVIATSDHGPAAYAGQREEATYLQLKELEQRGHYSSGPFRGYKFSVYEGGLRVPLVARWPGRIAPGTECRQLVGLPDLAATLAEVSGADVSSDQMPDSFSLLPLLEDPDVVGARDSMIFEATRAFAIRAGDWKLAFCPGSGSEGAYGNLPRRIDAWREALRNVKNRPRDHSDLLNSGYVQLFDLSRDPGERNNLAGEHPDKVRELHAMFQATVSRGRSTSGDALENDREGVRPFSDVPNFILQRGTPDLPLPAKAPGTSSDDKSSGLTVRESGGVIEVRWQGKPLLTYVKSERQSPEGIDPIYRRSGYLHPVFTPSGRIATGDFAPDHAHQHAIFNAWVRARFKGRKVDFWNQRLDLGRVSHARVVELNNGDRSVSFSVDLLHEAVTEKGGREPVLRERWTVTVHPPSGGAFVFDLDSTQTLLARTPLTIEKFHYGGMALRGANSWYREPGPPAAGDTPAAGNATDLQSDSRGSGHRFLTSDGLGANDGNHTRPAWVDLSGGRDETAAGIAVRGHEGNFRFPQPVRLHPKKPYFCFAPMVLGQFDIEPGVTYRSRYRFLVHDELLTGDQIEREWARFEDDSTHVDVE